MNYLLRRFLLLVGILCRGAAVQLGDTLLGHFALACIGAGVFLLGVSLHHRIERWLDGGSYTTPPTEGSAR